MSANIEILMGELASNGDSQERDVEFLLQNFLRALAEEQLVMKTSASDVEAL